MITVFTPAYNRAHTLGRLYDSLCRQISNDFEWLVVDDGSLDNTGGLIASFGKNENSFPIRYYRQENGGKHRAINKGVSLAKGKYFFFVDSDDYLPENAILLINSYLDDIEEDSSFCGIAGLRVRENGSVIGSYIPEPKIDTDFLSFRVKYKISGDYAEIIKTEILQKYPFPEFDGEKFCTEALILNRIAHKYKVRYLNLKIYTCEYLPGGLTDTYSEVMEKSPLASCLYYKELIVSPLTTWKQKGIYLSQYWTIYCKYKGEIPQYIAPTLGMFIGFPIAYLLKYSMKVFKHIRKTNGHKTKNQTETFDTGK